MSVKTKRDKNGLALSSRNSYLSKKGYLQSLYISKALLKVKTAWDEGLRDVRALEAIGIDFLSEKISKIHHREPMIINSSQMNNYLNIKNYVNGLKARQGYINSARSMDLDLLRDLLHQALRLL